MSAEGWPCHFGKAELTILYRLTYCREGATCEDLKIVIVAVSQAGSLPEIYNCSPVDQVPPETKSKY